MAPATPASPAPESGAAPVKGVYFCPHCGYDVSWAVDAAKRYEKGAADPVVACGGCAREHRVSALDRVPHGFGRTWRSLGWAGPLALVSSLCPPVGGFLLLAYLGTVSEFLQSQGPAGLALYIAAFAALAGLSLLPTYAQSAVGGYAFGLVLGIPAALAGFVGGALIGYEIARRASGEHVIAQIEARPKVRAVRDALISHRQGPGFWRTLGFVALLRLPPNSPFALTNLLMASVRVPRGAFLLGTLLGMAPRTAAAVFIGATAENLTGKESLRQPWWMWAVGIGVTVLVLAVIGYVANRAIERVTSPARPGGARPA